MNEYKMVLLEPTHWEKYRDMRLEALLKHPACFAPTRDEFKFTANEWRARLSNPNGAHFGLFFKDQLIGITGIYIDKDRGGPNKAHLVTSYIKEEFRKKGLSKKFYEARIEWAKKQGGVDTIVLEHRDDNTPSLKAHQKFGFKFVQQSNHIWADGQERPSMMYELKIHLQQNPKS